MELGDGENATSTAATSVKEGKVESTDVFDKTLDDSTAEKGECVANSDGVMVKGDSSDGDKVGDADRGGDGEQRLHDRRPGRPGHARRGRVRRGSPGGDGQLCGRPGVSEYLLWRTKCGGATWWAV